MNQRGSRSRAVVLAAFAGLAVVASTGGEAKAQAWVGYKGSLDAGLDYNYMHSSKLLAGDLGELDSGITTHQLTLSAEYVPVRKLAISVGLPFDMIKLTSDPATLAPHPGGGEYDDGDMHATLTDVHAQVRYAVLEAPFALAPHIGVSVPVADYSTIGNATAGRHVTALHLGLSVGYLFADTWYVHGSYEFSLATKYKRDESKDTTPMTDDAKKYSQNYSTAAFTIGHQFVSIGLDVHLDANFRQFHDGVQFEDFADLTADEQLFHDGILKEQVFLAGGGIDYQLTEKVQLSLSGRLFVDGANTQNTSVLAAGVSWSAL